MSFIDHFSYVLLSDSRELIEQFSQLHHQWWEKKLSTGYLVLASSVQFVLRDDWEGLEKNMFYFDKLIKKAKIIQYHKDFFVALMENNSVKATAAIETLCSKKIHRYNNDFPIKEEIISFPSVGYAKLAWLKGMKVQINNPLVPMELMPVQPLEHYENPYKHLWRLGEE
ncbi:Imm49 family immunity protein [Dyadobacter helix]|nr:Imm49 family immunity protein [Dyadobacter sp. CECT 9275]